MEAVPPGYDDAALEDPDMTDPTNDQPATQAATQAPGTTPPPEATTPPSSATAPQPPPSPNGDPPLQANPDRPADSGWREPPWIPRRDRRQRPSSPAAIVVGLILIAVGLWYFVDRTLGIALPRVSWSSLWPLILIVIGAVVLVRSFERR